MKYHNICFLGQTGFGKSSLINELFGTHFKTDPLVSCTKELYSVSVIESNEGEPTFITVYDTPGIGEFSNSSKYQEYYNYAVSCADHIVLVVTLDRIDRTSQDLLESIKPYVKEEVKFTIALNKIDSGGVGEKGLDAIAWDDDNNRPSNEWAERINKRIKIIEENYSESEYFHFLSIDRIIPVCAMRKYGIEELKKQILNK